MSTAIQTDALTHEQAEVVRAARRAATLLLKGRDLCAQEEVVVVLDEDKQVQALTSFQALIGFALAPISVIIIMASVRPLIALLIETNLFGDSVTRMKAIGTSMGAVGAGVYLALFIHAGVSM